MQKEVMAEKRSAEVEPANLQGGRWTRKILRGRSIFQLDFFRYSSVSWKPDLWMGMKIIIAAGHRHSTTGDYLLTPDR